MNVGEQSNGRGGVAGPGRSAVQQLSRARPAGCQAFAPHSMQQPANANGSWLDRHVMMMMYLLVGGPPSSS